MIVPISTYRNRIQGGSPGKIKRVGSISVKVKAGQSMKMAEDNIKELLRQRFKVQPGADDPFSVRNLTEMLQAPNTTLVAVAEVDLGRTKQLDEAHPGTKVFQDWRELLDKKHKEIDAVVIGTPDHLHAPIAMAAMQLGKHVYCEKPLTRTLQESRRLREFAAANQLMTQMGIQVASGSGNQTAVKLLQAGVVGKVKAVHSSCPKSWGDHGASARNRVVSRTTVTAPAVSKGPFSLTSDALVLSL